LFYINVMKIKDPLVSIIIPAFRSEYLIGNLIKSLQKTRYSNYEVIIVFDPCGDNGVQITRKIVSKDKRWIIIENTNRLGSTKSLNLGIKTSKGDLVAFVACDMTLDPNWLKELVRYLLKSDRSVGGVIAKFYDFHQHNLIQVYRHYLMRETGWIVSLDLGKKDGIKYQKPVETFNGFEGLVVRKEVFTIAGMFDEDIDALIYDLDMNWRVWLAGFRIVLVPNAKIYHWSLKEGRQNTKWEFFYGRMLNVFIKNYSLNSLIVYLPQFLIIYSLRALVLLLKGDSKAMVGWIQVLYWSFKHLPETLEKRSIIQTKVRRVSDKYLFGKIFFKGSIFDFYRYLKKAQNKITPLLLRDESLKKEVISYSV